MYYIFVIYIIMILIKVEVDSPINLKSQVSCLQGTQSITFLIYVGILLLQKYIFEIWIKQIEILILRIKMKRIIVLRQK